MNPPLSFLPLAVGAGAVLLGSIVTTGPRWQRVAGVLVAATGLLPEWLLPLEHPLLRAVASLAAFLGLMRVIDLTRGQWGLRARLVHAASPVDTRRIVPCPPSLHRRALADGLSWGLVALSAYWALPTGSHDGSASVWGGRWGCCLVLVYAAVCSGYRLFVVLYAAIGFTTPPLHVTPALSRSVQELWGERWARPVSAWLTETLMRPLARRRLPLTGVIAAFAASAVLHAYGVWVALGAKDGLVMAGWMLAYFVLQGVIVAIERRLRVRRWRPWAGHAWTIFWMLSTAPLFLEPALRVLGFPPP